MNRNEAGDVIHVTDQPVEEGQTVMAAVDWDRRLDHMQQHTGVLIDLHHCTRDFLLAQSIFHTAQCFSASATDTPLCTRDVDQLLCMTNR